MPKKPKPRLFIVRRVRRTHDGINRMVVRASSIAAARAQAAESAGSKIWLNENSAVVAPLDNDGREGVVLVDFCGEE